MWLEAGAVNHSERREPAQLRPVVAARPGHRLLAISVVAGAMTAAGCAQQSVTRDLYPRKHHGIAVAVSTRAGVEPDRGQRRSAERRMRWPDAGLLAPQQRPDCEFKGANAETMDAGELRRLKTEYERRCYQNAERAARDRLNSLQAAVRHMRD